MKAKNTTENGNAQYYESAMIILSKGNPILAHVKYSQRKIRTDGKAAKAMILAAYTAFMDPSDRIHCDLTGSSQSGKTSVTETVLETFPVDSVEIYSDVSEKHLYYLAKEHNFDNKIIYLDDDQEKHIPMLKTFRNDGSTSPQHGTVIDGHAVELKVNGRPVVIGSSVMPLRDLENQAGSRTFLIAIPDASPEEESEIHKTIIGRISLGALSKSKSDEQLYVLREMARILRDEGIDHVIIPFEVKEPKGADRRGTGQFVRFIKASAFINQFQRPIMELDDGTKYVLATYDDLKNAAEIWFSFGLSQEFKSNNKALVLLKLLPTSEGQGVTATYLSQITHISQKTVNRHLEDLYDQGFAYREKKRSPGSPYVYWTSEEISQKVMSEIPAPSDGAVDLGQIRTNSSCLKYMAENSSNSKISSIYELFLISDKIERKRIAREEGMCFIRYYLSHFAENLSEMNLVPTDIEELGHYDLPEMSEIENSSADSEELGQVSLSEFQAMSAMV